MYFWLYLLFSFVVFTYFMKYVFKAQTFFIFSLVKNESISKLLDKLRFDIFWDFISKLGIFLGFGLISTYYFYEKDNKRISKMLFYQILIFLCTLPFVVLMYFSFGKYLAILFLIVANIFGFAYFSLLAIVISAFVIIKNYFLGVKSLPGIAPLIPGVEIPNVPFTVPFFEGWIALCLILIVHEFAHGILSRMANIEVKSFGLILVGFFPIGAFTEPSEEDLEKASNVNKLKIFAAGPSSNLFFALVCSILLLILSLSTLFYVQGISDNLYSGVYIQSFESSSINKDFNSNVDIISVNGHIIKTSLEFVNINKSIIADGNKDAIFLVNDNGNIYEMNLKYNESNKLGIITSMRINQDYNPPLLYKIISFIISLLGWLVFLNIAIALVNYIPSEPFDGGKMNKIILSRYILKGYDDENKFRKIGKFFGYLFLFLVFLNILPFFF